MKKTNIALFYKYYCEREEYDDDLQIYNKRSKVERTKNHV